MSGVSNVGPTGSNSGDSTRVVVSGKKNVEIIVFVAYKQFKQQVQNEYKNYQNDVEKEYEEYRNNALKEYNSFRENETAETSFDEAYVDALKNPENWQKYEVHEGIKSPIMNKPETAPVYNPEDHIQPTKVELDNVSNQAPVYYEDSKPEVSSDNQSKQKPVEIKRGAVNGKYIISSSDDGKGFDVKQNFSVGMNHEAKKFFANASTMALDDKDKIKKDKNGNYSYRGIKTKNYNVLRQQLTLSSQRISINNAIYNDLIAKKNSGTELTEPEQNFVEYHLRSLERNKLGVDENGNLIDKM